MKHRDIDDIILRCDDIDAFVTPQFSELFACGDCKNTVGIVQYNFFIKRLCLFLIVEIAFIDEGACVKSLVSYDFIRIFLFYYAKKTVGLGIFVFFDINYCLFIESIIFDRAPRIDI